MEIQKKHIKTDKEYTDFVRSFVTLLDEQFNYWEKQTVEGKRDDLHYLARQMPALISLVNTMGYLRGQDAMFLDIRPHTEHQQEFYQYEYAFEERMKKFIDMLMASEEKDYYIERLDSYLIKTRTQQKPTIV
jgi:hypothetical protein